MLGLLAALALSYIAGSFPTSLIVGRAFFGLDPRTAGSGNAGGTNAIRLFGWKAGLAVALVDIGKGALASLLLWRLADGGPLPPDAARILCGSAAVAGHVWTIFAGFRGGKGVATATGAILGLAPAQAGIAALAFFLCLGFTGIVSLSSILAAIAFAATTLATYLLGWQVSSWLLGFSLVLPPFILWTHRKNIQRLVRGRESRFERIMVLSPLYWKKRKEGAKERDKG